MQPGPEIATEPDSALARSRAASATLPLPRLVQLAWVQALIATCGSLYFSEVMKLTPCVLCWYQRIAMYPLVIVLGVGLLLRERRIHFYALPLSLIGLAVSIYHNLLYFGILPESIQACTAGVSCITRQIEWFGFLTIPLMSLVAFCVINAALIAYSVGGGGETEVAG